MHTPYPCSFCIFFRYLLCICCWSLLSTREVRHRPAGACAGMEYLHSAGILHGDLKPANVLLKSTSADRRGFTCKLCDFGMSRLMDATQATHVSTQTYGVSRLPGPCCPPSDNNMVAFLSICITNAWKGLPDQVPSFEGCLTMRVHSKAVWNWGIRSRSPKV